MYLIGHALLIGVSVFVCLARNKKGDRAALALLFSTLLMGMGLASWSARFLAMYFVPASIVFGIGLVVLADRLAAYFKEKMISIQQIHHSQKIIALGLIAIMTTAILGWTTPILSQAMYKTRPIVRSSDLASIDALNGMFPNDVKLWATHGIEYFITSRTGYEAAPENGQADFPVLAALRMYNEITNNARESYHIADPSSHFYRSFHPIENDLLTVTSFDYFSMIESTFNITIQAKVPLYAIKLDIASSIEGAEEPEFHYSFWLMPRLGNIWTQEIDIRGLPEDTYAITITPFLNPPPRSPPKEDILGTFTEPIFIYRWDDLPRPHIHLEELITLYGTAGLYQIYSVNLTTAQAIDLLNRNTLRASLPPPPGPPIYYMYVLTPLFYLTPIIGDLSNFVIILVFCPLMGLYWLSAGIALVVVVVRLKEKYWQESLSTGELSTE